MAGFRDDREALRAKLEATEEALELAQAEIRALERARAAAPKTRSATWGYALGFGGAVALAIAAGVVLSTSRSDDALSNIDVPPRPRADPPPPPRDVARDAEPEFETAAERIRHWQELDRANAGDARLREATRPRLPVEPGWSVRITASGGGPPVGTTCALWVEAGRALLPSAATVECPGDVDLFFGVVQDDAYETGPCQLLTEPEVILTCAAGSETIDTEAGAARLTDEQGRNYELEILARIDH